MTHVDRGDLIHLLANGIGEETARSALEEDTATRSQRSDQRLDPADALALLSRLAARGDAIGVAAGLAHQRLGLRLARSRGLAARVETSASPRRSGWRDGA